MKGKGLKRQNWKGKDKQNIKLIRKRKKARRINERKFEKKKMNKKTKWIERMKIEWKRKYFFMYIYREKERERPRK